MKINPTHKNVIQIFGGMNLPCHIFAKDIDGYYRFCNQKMASDLGLESVDAIIGKHDRELVWKDFSSGLREHDKAVMVAEKDYDFVEPVKLFYGKEVNLLSYKYPIENSSGNVDGIFGISFVNFYSERLLDKLSSRQQQCIQLTMYGFSSKEIARVLCLSYRTVEDYLDKAREKLNCRNRSHLVAVFLKEKLLSQLNLNLFKIL